MNWNISNVPRYLSRWACAVRTLAVAALLALGLGLQVRFFHAFPQPYLFGDPAGYYTTGQRFLDALQQISQGGSVLAALDAVRGLFYLVGVGALFALLEAIRPGDFAFFRLFFAACNTLAMLGAFLLARRLTRSDGCGLLALAVAAVYPSFALQTGRLYPDPLTGALFVWSAWAYVGGVQRSSWRWMTAAGLLFVVALLVRLQIAVYMMLVLPLAFAASAFFWLRSSSGRRLALALALSILPIYLVWAGVVRAVGGRDDVTRLGNFTFQTPYLMGFWQQLETDGWVGPYRFREEPYYKALEERNRIEPGLLRSRGRQAWFVLRYVSRWPLESALVVLNNAYRLFDRPANDFKWDYPFSYEYQVWLQRILCVLALAGVALYASRRSALLGAFVLPLSLLPLHGLLFSWPRYNMPVMPLLIAAAGAFAGEIVGRRSSRCAVLDRRVLITAGIGVLFVIVGWSVFIRAPEIGHAFSVAGTVLLLAVPFFVVVVLPGAPRRWVFPLLGYLMLLVLFLGHVLRDRLWHETKLTLGRDVSGVEQEIWLPADAIATLRQAAQSFIVFDLRIPRGDRSSVSVSVGSRTLAGERLTPTMPPLGESTYAGGRDWRGYPQWWAIPVEPWMIPSSEQAPLRIALRAESHAALELSADRFHDQGQVYQGPSFSDWPHWVALKMEYDGDSRLPVRTRLSSRATTSYAIEADGARRRLRSVLRIRAVVIGNNLGETSWVSARSARGTASWGFCAYSEGSASADLRIDDHVVLRFPLGAREDFEASSGPYTLCHRALPEKGYKTYGGYVLSGPAPKDGASLRFKLRFLSGMSHKPIFFVVDRKWDPSVLRDVCRRCGVPTRGPCVDGVAEVLSADRNNYPDDTGWWTVKSVY